MHAYANLRGIMESDERKKSDVGNISTYLFPFHDSIQNVCEGQKKDKCQYNIGLECAYVVYFFCFCFWEFRALMNKMVRCAMLFPFSRWAVVCPPPILTSPKISNSTSYTKQQPLEIV